MPSTSLRRRLFNNSQRRRRRPVAAEHDNSPVLVVSHNLDTSGSTSTTLAQDDGQALSIVNEPSTNTRDSPVDDTDRERGSLNTTLTGHNKFYQRKVIKPSASDVAFSSTTSHSLVKKRRTKPNRSLFSRVVRRVVPCVNSSSSTHRPSLDNADPEKTSREMSTVRPADLVISPPPIESTGLSLPPPISIQPPPSPTDSEIIVPPPPSSHLLPEDETDGLTSGAVQPPGSTGDTIVRIHTRDSEETDRTSFTEDEPDDHIYDDQAEEERLIRDGGAGIPIVDGVPKPLLPPIAPHHVGRKCLVLDLDETLVHSSFKAIPQADFIVPVEIECHWHHFHVLKRPGVDAFLQKMGELYEVVVFTASLSKYADPVLDKLDLHQAVTHRLFRESCFNHKGNYVKDLSQLGRPIADTIILDNSPASYIFHPNNAVPVSSWFNDPHDAELTDLVPFLADLCEVPDIRGILNPSC